MLQNPRTFDDRSSKHIPNAVSSFYHTHKHTHFGLCVCVSVSVSIFVCVREREMRVAHGNDFVFRFWNPIFEVFFVLNKLSAA